jgi:hypothetical protein
VTVAAALAGTPGLPYKAAEPPGAPRPTTGPSMTDTLPDRLAIDPASPHHDAELIERGVGIIFNGTEKTNVEEYCVSEGWIRVAAGKARDRQGNPLTIKLKGAVEPYLRNAEATEAKAESDPA